jgi:hypothetical protein
MFRLFSVLFVSALAAAAVAAPFPTELEAALQHLQTDAPRGWAFTQTSEGAGRSRVERFEPIGPSPTRWRLLQVDGREPTESEQQTYRKQQVLREGAVSAPNVKEQIDRDTGELISDDGERVRWRFRLLPAPGDAWAPYMAATFTLHRPTGAIERVELASLAPFSPMFLTNVEEARTVMQYSLPGPERPALLEEIQVHIRGRAWFVRSLDSNLTVRYSDYRYVAKR